MELRALKLFLDIAATGSFSRTAMLDMTTQSTVSKSITQLETELAHLCHQALQIPMESTA